MKEIWKAVKGYKNLYEVSSRGRIRSLKRNTTSGKVLKHNHTKDGYPYVGLCKENVTTMTKIHRLVATAFIPNKKGKPQVNHKNGIKTDNRVGNLEWVTVSENMRHAYRLGLHSQSGERHAGAKLTEKVVREIRSLVKSGKVTQRHIAKRFGVCPATICLAVSGENWGKVK